MNNWKQKQIASLVYEHIFFIVLAFLILGGYWFSTQRISLWILRPAFFTLFFKAGLIVWFFLFLGRFGTLLWARLPSWGRTIVMEGWIPLLLIAVSLYQFHKIWEGEFPSTTDHTTQILRCYLTELALGNHGTLLPWTSAIGAGLPLNDLYPPGGAMLYCALRFLSFFLLSQKIAYVMAVFISWFTLLGGLYACGRSFFGIAGGALAAGLMAMNPGNVAQAGWVQPFFLGMWQTTLCCGLILIALTVHGHTLGRMAGRWLLPVLTLSVAGAILAHPFGLPALFVTLLVLTILPLFCSEDRLSQFRFAIRNGIFILLGVLLAGWWLFPFMASGSWVLPFGAPNQSSYSLAASLVDNSFFACTPPIITSVITIGIVWGLFSRRMVPAAFSLSAIFFLILNQNTWMTCFFSPLYTNIMMNVPLGRFASMTKMLGLVLAGGMAHNALSNSFPLLASVRRFTYANMETAGEMPPSSVLCQAINRSLALILIGMAIAPAASNISLYLVEHYSPPDSYTLAGYPEYPPYAKDYEQAMLRLQSLDPGPGEESFFRPLSFPKISVQTNIAESSIPFRFGYGIVSPFYTPTLLFTTRASRGDASAPRLSGEKYTMAIAPVEKYISQQPGTRKIFQIGTISIFQQENYSAIPVQILHASSGQCEIKTSQPGHLSIQLSGLPGETWVRAGVSRYRKWRAFQNGVELPIAERIEAGESNDVGRYISVLASNGPLELRYAPESIDWISYALTLLAGLFLLTCLVIRPVYRIVSLESPFAISALEIVNGVRIRSAISLAVSFLILAVILGLRFERSTQKTQFWYTGILSDVVSPLEWKSDGNHDLGFALVIGEDLKEKTLETMTLREIYPEPAYPSPHTWITGQGPFWKLAVHPIADSDAGWHRRGIPFGLRLNPPHFLTLFASNPHRGEYIPTGTEMELTLNFLGGESATYRCALLPQGTH